jgi:hypothetical protein
MRLTRLLLAALLAALALVPASTAQDTPPEATTSAEVAPQSMILRSPLPIIRGPPNPTTAPGTYPDPTCPGSDDNNPPDFERLANGEATGTNALLMAGAAQTRRYWYCCTADILQYQGNAWLFVVPAAAEHALPCGSTLNVRDGQSSAASTPSLPMLLSSLG